MHVGKTHPIWTIFMSPTFNFSREFFKTYGISNFKRNNLHTFPAKYFSEFNPQATVFTEWSEKSAYKLRLKFKLHFSNNSDIIRVDIVFLILYVSIANERIFL